MTPETLRKLAEHESNHALGCSHDGARAFYDGRASAFSEIAAMLEAEHSEVKQLLERAVSYLRKPEAIEALSGCVIPGERFAARIEAFLAR